MTKINKSETGRFRVRKLRQTIAAQKTMSRAKTVASIRYKTDIGHRRTFEIWAKPWRPIALVNTKCKLRVSQRHRAAFVFDVIYESDGMCGFLSPARDQAAGRPPGPQRQDAIGTGPTCGHIRGLSEWQMCSAL